MNTMHTYSHLWLFSHDHPKQSRGTESGHKDHMQNSAQTVTQAEDQTMPLL